ncbi:MFS general substrate transporter [Sphaerosporella brunnea]|uniref:MFS general substrate transporter n=1 Tax=Sphaerosporella brunnea TaxID=1250544 RepID=A0A5J5F200_9PEZI|nr:MFS general substrate transporter [Sphaerosporella brunnea]
MSTPKEVGAVTSSSTTVPLRPWRRGVLPDAALDQTYVRKAHTLNAAIQEIGMGSYQWSLFFVAGFGWCSDSLWQQVPGIILPVIIAELHPPRLEYLALAQNLGLAAGSLIWGLGADIVGRRWVFNFTLLLAGLFGTAAGASPSFAAMSVFVALWSVGVGGNIPVDTAVFLEFLPGSHQWLLAGMNLWWCLGQIIASGIAWPLLVHFSCKQGELCEKRGNMGWRYYLYAMGGLTLLLFLLRFLAFTLHESPKFLMGRGNDLGAAAVVQKVAHHNGVDSSFSVEDLKALDLPQNSAPAASQPTSNGAHIRPLFATAELTRSTLVIMLMWFLTGLGFPLYNAFLPYFLTRIGDAMNTSMSETFRNYLIILVMNIPGVALGTAAIEIPGVGRKGAMSFGAVLTGTFLLAGTTARTSSALLGWNCAYAVAGTMMAAVMYAYTPEVFPTKHRGTGNGLAMTANRIGGILAPVIAMYADLNTPVPVYIAGSMFIVAGGVMWLLPYESHRKTSL